MIGIFFLQILLLTFTGIAFKVYGNFGLTIQQWLICIGFGLTVLPVNLLLKCYYVPELPVEEPIANES